MRSRIGRRLSPKQSTQAGREAGFYMASTIKRQRRTKAEMEAFREAIYSLLDAFNPMTVRQVFYQLVAQGVIQKTEGMYDSVQQNLVDMRRQKIVPYKWISDNTRWMRKPDTYSSMRQMLMYSVRTYRRAVWDDQNAYVEIWCEKDALAGVIAEETYPYDVPLMVGRGFSSLTYLYNAAQNIEAQEKPTYIYYFGDHDPDGKLIPQVLERELRRLAPKSEIHFTQAAITIEQIVELNLPTRPTKRETKRGKEFEGDSVDLDAMSSVELRRLVKHCIEQHIDQGVYARTMQAERMEMETLRRIESTWEQLIA